LPRDDAARWSKKVTRIIKGSLKPGEEEKKDRDDDYHQKVLDRIASGRAKETDEEKI
jgi:hypothetical protein